MYGNINFLLHLQTLTRYWSFRWVSDVEPCNW